MSWVYDRIVDTLTFLLITIPNWIWYNMLYPVLDFLWSNLIYPPIYFFWNSIILNGWENLNYVLDWFWTNVIVWIGQVIIMPIVTYIQ